MGPGIGAGMSGMGAGGGMGAVGGAMGAGAGAMGAAMPWIGLASGLMQGIGGAISESKDRNYFHSIYFRTPAGALFEAAYSAPEGFCIDEPYESLGHDFKLPPWVDEQRRAEIMGQLEKITF